MDWSAFPYGAVIVPPVRAQDQPEGYNPWRGVQVQNYTSAANDIPEVYRAFLADKLQPELRLLSERFGDRVARWQEQPADSKVDDKVGNEADTPPRRAPQGHKRGRVTPRWPWYLPERSL